MCAAISSVVIVPPPPSPREHALEFLATDLKKRHLHLGWARAFSLNWSKRHQPYRHNVLTLQNNGTLNILGILWWDRFRTQRFRYGAPYLQQSREIIASGAQSYGDRHSQQHYVKWTSTSKKRCWRRDRGQDRDREQTETELEKYGGREEQYMTRGSDATYSGALFYVKTNKSQINISKIRQIHS